MAPEKAGEMLVPKSRKDGGGSTKVMVPRMVQRFMFIEIRGTAPLGMDKMSDRVTTELRNKKMREMFKAAKKEMENLTKAPPGTPMDLFVEAMHQHCNGKRPYKETVALPFKIPGMDSKFKVVVRPAFPSVAVKKGMVRAAKDIVAAGIIMNKSFPGIVERNVHVQGSVFPIDFKRLEMVEFVVTAFAQLKWLPVFYDWTGTLLVSWNANLVNTNDVLSLVENAGSMAGIGIQRPELGKLMGTYEIGKTRMAKLSEAEKWIREYAKEA